MQSGFRPTGFYRTGSATCSNAQSGDRRTRCIGSTQLHLSGWKLDQPRQAIAKVEWHPGELYPRVGFIVINLSRPADRVVGRHLRTVDQGR